MGKRVVLVELGDHARGLKNWVDSPDVTFVALTPEADYYLERERIAHTRFDEYFSFREHFSALSGVEARCDALAAICDRTLNDLDGRFATAGIEPFRLHRHPLEYSLGDCIAAIFKLHAIVSRERPTSLHIVRTVGDPACDAFGYGIVRDTALQHMLKIAAGAWGISAEYIQEEEIAAGEYRLPVLVEPSRIRRLRNSLRRHARQLPQMGLAHFLKRILPHRYRCLSVACRDLEYLSLSLALKGWRIDVLNPGKATAAIRSSQFERKDEFIDHLRRHEEHFSYLGVNFFRILADKFRAFLDTLESLLQLQLKLDNELVNRMRYDIVAFVTHSPADPVNIILPLVLEKRGVPWICWMHGFYGANITHTGFRNTDWSSSKQYFVYGRGVKRAIEAQHGRMRCHVAGSPRIEAFKASYVAPKNERKKIVFVMCSLNTNRKSLTLNSPDDPIRYWPTSRKIIDLLILYRHSWDIVLRVADYFGHEARFLKQYLDDHGAGSIAISGIQDEPLHNVYREMDACILTWASTTLIEACCTDAEVFLYDRSDLTEEAKSLIPSRITWSDDSERFVELLSDYLKNPTRLRSADDRFLSEYLDSGNASRRSEIVEELLIAIASGNALGAVANDQPH